jgi:hypothetical protein
MSRDPVIIYHAANLQQAHLLKEALAEVGFEAWVESAFDHHLGENILAALPRVVVRREDAEEARLIAEEFDQLLRLPRLEGTEMSIEPHSSAEGEVIDAWPTCPQCGKRRNAECLTCHAAGDYFPPAYQHDGEANGMWMCPSCDDTCQPRYFRRCHHCGHDFGDGFEPAVLPREDNERRAWLVIWTMLGGALLLGAYFSWIFRR